MTTINNQTTKTLKIEVFNDNGTSYTTTIPGGGAFSIPAEANAVNVLSVE